MATTEFNTNSTMKVEEFPEKVEIKDMPENGDFQFREYIQVFIGETLATGILICVGCMTCVKGFEGNVTMDFHSAFGFGFIVAALIAVFGHVTGAHMNPAVTVTLYILGAISFPMMFNYFIAEVLGAALGFGVLTILTPSELINGTTCTTVPANEITSVQALGIEFIITCLLLFVVCGLCDLRNEKKQDSAPLKFAAIIIGVSLAAGKYTGASMNPARSFGPALWTGNWTAHWVYWLGPLTAGVVAPLTYLQCFSEKTTAK